MTTGGWVVAFAALWLFALVTVVLNFARGRLGTIGRWSGIGWLLMASAMLVNTFSQYRGWSSSRVHSFLNPVILVAVILMAAPVVVMERDRRRARREGH
jgi:hypothetical protein